MITRQEYMKGKASHRDYYGQFITPQIKELVEERAGDLIRASVDPYFDDVPLKFWDSLGPLIAMLVGQKMVECGDCITQAGLVCVTKEAARQVLEQSDISLPGGR